MNDPTAQSLDAIRRELTQTLDGLRSALETAVDERPDRETLRRCAERLDLARGGLRRVDARGAALLVEEMAAVCRHLPAVESRQALETGVETLTRALVELAAHLDRPLGAHGDVTPALLPLINRLRAVSGRQRLSEAPRAGLDESAATVTAPPGEALCSGAGQERFRDTARTLRPAFQIALLGWIRDEHATAHLVELARVSRALEEAATSDSVRQLWYVLTVVLRGLAEGGCEPTVALKRLLGQADRQLKRLIDEGDASFAESPPVELIDHPDALRCGIRGRAARRGGRAKDRYAPDAAGHGLRCGALGPRARRALYRAGERRDGEDRPQPARVAGRRRQHRSPPRPATLLSQAQRSQPAGWRAAHRRIRGPYRAAAGSGHPPGARARRARARVRGGGRRGAAGTAGTAGGGHPPPGRHCAADAAGGGFRAGRAAGGRPEGRADHGSGPGATAPGGCVPHWGRSAAGGYAAGGSAARFGARRRRTAGRRARRRGGDRHSSDAPAAAAALHRLEFERADPGGEPAPRAALRPCRRNGRAEAAAP